MPQDSLLTVSDISQELNIGKASVKFVIKRFKNMISFTEHQGQPMIPAGELSTIAEISEKLDMGMKPSDIDQDFENNSQNRNTATSGPAGTDDIRLSPDGLDLLKSLFNEIGEQQRRIAEAHETRAAAEERKAVAIEKRAAAEEKKAQAMNNIANALQEMNQIRAAMEPTAEQIAHKAVSVVAEDEIDPDNFDQEDILGNEKLPDSSLQPDDLSSLIEDDGDILDDLVISQDLSDIDQLDTDEEVSADFLDDDTLSGLDNLSQLIDDHKEDVTISDRDDHDDLDDLYALIEDGQFENNKIVTDHPPNELDDLYQLIDSVSIDSPDAELDDLSKLIDDGDEQPASERDDIPLDDLSLLIDTPNDAAASVQDTQPASEMDDLYKLIDQSDEQDQPSDIAALTDDNDLDDLSLLIEMPDDSDESSSSNGLAAVPEITIEISPQDDIEKYKAEIMRVIIGLKNEGNDAQTTTNILNHNNIKTLSGKPEWGLKAISQIYKFIESVS